MQQNDFERVFKRHLKALGYTEARLAQYLHVTPGAVTRWVKGQNHIPHEVVQTLAQLWHLSKDEKVEFFELANYPLPPEFGEIKTQHPSTLEALTPDYIHRPQEFATLKESLLHQSSGQLTAITSALKGAGGYGKTTLALALCHDPDVQAAFPDGIEWVTLGEALRPGELVEKIRALIYRLEQTMPPVENLETASAFLRIALEGRHLLLVIDDVWFTSNLKPFLQGGQHCARLVTTRNEGVLPPGVLGIRVDAMSPEEAIQLLSKETGTSEECKQQEQTLYNLAQRLKEWPLLLTLVNGVLRNRIHKHQQSLANALDYLDHELTKYGVVAFDPYQPHERHEAVARTLEISFALLSADDYAHYLQLAIFPEDADIPFAKIWLLWNDDMLDREDVETICLRLYDLSLVRSLHLGQQHLKLHDVLREYLQTKTKQMIASYQQTFLRKHGVQRWADLALDDTYLWNYLLAHLLQAEQPQVVLETVTDLRYLARKIFVQQSSYAAEADIEYVHTHLVSKNTLLTDLKETLALFGDLLNLCETLPEIEGLLLLQVSQQAEMERPYRRLREEMTHPYLSPWRPLPIRSKTHLIRTLQQHTAPVLACAISSHSNWVVSASTDKTLNVWDAATGALRFTLRGHTEAVTGCIITPDESRIISTSEDGTIRIWNMYSGSELLVISGHIAPIWDCALSPNGSWLATGSEDKTIKIWDIRNIYALPTARGYKVTLKRTLRGHRGPIRCCTISADGSWLVSASNDQTLRFWKLGTGEELQPPVEQQYVQDCAISRDGSWLVLTDEIGLQVRERTSGTELITTYGHSGDITSCALSPDESWMLSASLDGSLKGWLARQDYDIFLLHGHRDSVNDCAINTTGTRIISASDDGTLKIWQVPEIRQERMSDEEEYFFALHGCAIAPSGTWAVAISLDGSIQRWDLNQEEPPEKFVRAEQNTSARCAISADERLVVTSSGMQGETLTFWDATTGEEACTLEGHTEAINHCAISPDMTWAVTASEDQTLIVWNIERQEQRLTLKGQDGAINSCAISSDGQWIVSASSDQTLSIWNVQTGRQQRNWQAHDAAVRDCAILAGDEQLLSCADDGTIKLWRLANLDQPVSTFIHPGKVERCIISPDEKLFFSLSETQLKLWQLSSGDCLLTFYTHQQLYDCAFHPDGNHLIVAADDGLAFLTLVL